MNVRGDRPRHELEARLVEWAGNAASIPSIVKSAVAHRKRIGKNRRRIIEQHRHAVFVTLIYNRAHPSVADFLPPTGFMGTVHECAPPQSVFLRLDRISNHLSYRRALWRIEPGNEENRCRGHLANRAESLKIRVGNRARDLSGEETERAQLRINGSFVAALNGATARRTITRIRRRGRTYLQRHAPNESDEMNPKCLHSLVSIGRFVNVPPLPLLKSFAQRLGDRGVVLLARNFFPRWTVESDEVIISDCTFVGIKFRERFRIGNGGVKNNDGLSRQI